MKILYFWKPVLWLSFICYGLFIPASSIPSKPILNIPHFDKLVHFALFFGLCILLFRPLKKIKLKYMVIAPVISIGFGLTLELIQQQVAITRSSDFYDFLANFTGVLFAVLFYHFLVNDKKWEILF